MTILGVIASSTRQGQTTDLGAFYPLGAVTVTASGTSTITFSSIPNTYKHLQIRYIARNAAAANSGYFNMRFNGDTSTANYYAYHELFADGATATGYNAATVSGGLGGIQIDQFVGNNRTASVYGAGIIDILDYSSTNKNKVVRHFNGYDYNGGGVVVLGSGLWKNSSNAVSSITLINSGGNDLSLYSQFALYGVKSA